MCDPVTAGIALFTLAAGAYQASRTPDVPDVKPPKTDPEENRRRTAEAARRARQRAKGGFGHSDTIYGGASQAQLGTSSASRRSYKMLLGS